MKLSISHWNVIMLFSQIAYLNVWDSYLQNAVLWTLWTEMSRWQIFGEFYGRNMDTTFKGKRYQSKLSINSNYESQNRSVQIWWFQRAKYRLESKTISSLLFSTSLNGYYQIDCSIKILLSLCNYTFWK